MRQGKDGEGAWDCPGKGLTTSEQLPRALCFSSLNHRKGLEKEQETLGDPKPWKWNNKLERMKVRPFLPSKGEAH